MDNFAGYKRGVLIFEFDPENWLFYLFMVYGLSVLVQLGYTWILLSRFAFYKPPSSDPGSQPVSVVICAKDEYHNLKRNLPFVLEQDYPDFEVVVVNDASDDETEELLKDLAREYERLKPVTISQNLNFFKGKKFPLSLGIKSAKHDLILLTDADCRPESPQWIARMTSAFGEDREIVLGYGRYEMKSGVLNRIIRYETLITALQYFSYALAGLPYMGVGRNLAYRKSLFYKNKGFISHYRIHSGDDDLFVNRVAHKGNTAIEVHPGSITVSRPKSGFGDWWRQKKRHISTAKHYRPLHKTLLWIYNFTQMMTWAGIILLIILSYNIIFALSLFAIRLISQLVILHGAMVRLNEKKLLLISPLMDLFLSALYPVLGFSNWMRKPDKWK